MSFQALSGGALQAAGDSMTPLKAETVNRILHITLSPTLIFGWFGMPEMGLTGVATAALIARSCSVGLNFYALVKGTSRLHLQLSAYRIDWSLIGQIVRLGLPASITGLQRGLSPLALVAIVAPFGDGAVAAMVIMRRTEAMATQASQPIGKAAGAIAGQNLAIDQASDARKAVTWGMMYVAVISLVLALLFLVVPTQIVSIVNSDPEFLESTSNWLRILALGYVGLTLAYFLVHTFNFAGNTLFPMIATLSIPWLVEVPLTFILSHLTELGQYGIAWALVIGSILRLAVLAWYFERDRWLRSGLL